ncbi:hypothetical protein [Halobacillus sp. A5]|uniref:hypothetical protein n=1 Tax=Halobacillus sp. A5 TaxID=2880263 RepID=UPI0020A67638|nr:hypothetical protein [Halobacillus sp. A5]MCP3028154.1 hypothetical protein [Halobacillus sp. A5]
MISVHELIKRDGVRQLVTGALLIAVMSLFLISFFLIGVESLLLNTLYGTAFGLAGIAVFRSGWLDIIQANHSVGFKEDLTTGIYEQLPGRMYIGHQPHSIFQAHLYDMNGEVYGRINQHTHFDIKLFRPFISIFSGGALFPATYKMMDNEGKAVYHLVKKGAKASLVLLNTIRWARMFRECGLMKAI